jgi:hypothetical protein
MHVYSRVIGGFVVVALVASCAADAPPPRPVARALPSVAPPPPEPPPFRGIEHPRFEPFGVARWMYGGALARQPPRTPLPLGQSLRIRYLACDFDGEGTAERGRCRAVTRAAFDALDLGGIDRPRTWKLWPWLESHFTLADAPVDQTIAQRYARAHAKNEALKLGPELLVTSEITTTLVDEVVGVTAPGADPISRRTGRKVKRAEHAVFVLYEGAALPSVMIDDYVMNMTELTGSGAERVTAQYIDVSSTAATQPPLTALVTAGRVDWHRRAEVLSALEESVEDHFDVRVAVLVDRALLAWDLGNAAALRRATDALDAELARDQPFSPVVRTAAATLVPALHRLRDDARVSIATPNGLDAMR